MKQEIKIHALWDTEAVRSRLKNATLEQLELWAENILDAATIEDAFQIH